MSQKEFFDDIRKNVFGGMMTAAQVAGVTRIIEYRDTQYRGVTNNQLAYILATCFHETARKCTPCTEYGSAAYLRSKKYFPYVGRGLVQLTWQKNYERYGISNPADALAWPVALHVCFDGMVTGKFTGKKLSDYISGAHVDYIGARRIINGTDRASLIAGYAGSFQKALVLWQPSPTPAAAAKSIKVKEKSFFDQIGEFFGVGQEEAPAAKGAPMPPPMPAPLTGMAGYTLSAVVAAVGALQLIPWDEVIRHPDVGMTMVITAVGTAVARAVLPTWLQWFVLKSAT